MNLNGPITGDPDLDVYLFYLKKTVEDLIYIIDQQNKNGYTGTFTAGASTVTVNKGIITDVTP